MVDAVPVLEAVGLNKRFGAVVAADDINLSISRGERVGIIGSNGAGKTTFVNMVTGYLTPDSGVIRHEGRDITGLSSAAISRLGVHRSFQIAQVFPEMTVFDNLMVALGVDSTEPLPFWKPLRRASIIDRTHRILDQYRIADYRDQRTAVLPQGVRKLLDIAMAMVGEPSVLLLDEPTSGISADEKMSVMDTIVGALGDSGVTVLFIEHDMEVVERYAGRVAAFYDGAVIADGAPSAVLNDPDVRTHVIGPELHRSRQEG